MLCASNLRFALTQPQRKQARSLVAYRGVHLWLFFEDDLLELVEEVSVDVAVGLWAFLVVSLNFLGILLLLVLF